MEGRDYQWLQAERSNHGEHEPKSAQQIWRRLPQQTSHGRLVVIPKNPPPLPIPLCLLLLFKRGTRRVTLSRQSQMD